MKPHFKTFATALALAVLGGCMPALGAVPLRWNVETSRAQPASFDVYRGETLLLTADMTSYGRPLEMAGAAALYIQTNGMADVWWTIPATVATNRIEATLSPTNYPGDAQVLNCYLGGPATSYRAAFRLRVLGAPGPAPEAVQFPVRSLDFANVVVSNAPWLPLSNGQTDSLRVTERLYFGNPPSSGGQGFANKYLAIGEYGSFVTKSPEGRTVRILDEYNFPDVFGELYGEDLATLAGMVTEHDGSLSVLASTVSALSTTQAQDHATIAAWQTYWDGDDVRLTVTNYYGSADYPHLYLEQKVSDGGTNYFKRVWDEVTRHDAILSRIASVETNVSEKADKAWGFYDSHTGGYSPDGFTSISSQNIIVAPGMSYQKTVSAAGNAIWVLTYNDATTFSGVTSNGFFRVSDGEGSTLFEIVKGDKRTVGATAASISVNGTQATIVYNVSSDSPPDLQYCTDLASDAWAEVISSGASIGRVPRVTWSGSSGEWTASINLNGSQPFPTAPERMFFKATYETGGETYIKNAAPISVEGGILCTDGLHKVRPVYNNGTITWQVVQ